MMGTEERYMAAGGVVRKIDKLGRIVIPAEYRKSIGIKVEEEVEILLEGNFVKICKHENGCVFCGEKISTNVHHGKLVCEACRKTLARD
jgi:transcriptional pleiotropic regulator of transition state genes